MKKRIVTLMLILGLVLYANTVLASSADIVTAVIDGKTADRVHLRERPSAKSKSLGLYFTGTEVRYAADSVGEWVWVNVGTEAGYIKSEFLDLGSNVVPQQPLGIVKNSQGGSWVNLRVDPSIQSDSISRLSNDETVTILGETATKWYYVQSGDQYGYIMADYLQVGRSGNTVSGGAASGSSQVSTTTADPKDSVQAYVTIKNCTLNIVPSDVKRVECTYDASALRFEQSIARGVHMLAIESINGRRVSDNATATLSIPRALYHALFVDVQTGEASIAGGMDMHMDITGTDARLSVYYPAGNVYDYLMRFRNSTCVVGISENASNYAIDVRQVTDSSIKVPDEMPSIKGNDTTIAYGYVTGNGNAKITIDTLDYSNLEFVFVR